MAVYPSVQGASLLSLSNILKEYYLGPVTEQLNNEVLLLSRLEARSEDLVGKRAYVPLHYGRSTGIGARSEAAALPNAGQQAYNKAVYDLKYLYGRVAVTGPSMAKTKNEAGAFLQALKSELDGVRNDLRKDLARQIYSDGSGVISAITVATSAASVWTLTVGYEAAAKGQFYVGMKVDTWSLGATPASTSTGGTITAVNLPANPGGTTTLTVTGVTGTPAATNGVVRQGVQIYATSPAPPDGVENPENWVGAATGVYSGGTWSLSDEVDGLRRVVADDPSTMSFGGIDVTQAANAWWKNISVDSGANGFALDTLQQTLNKVRIAGGIPSAIVTSFGLQRQIYNQLSDNVRYVDPESYEYASGYKSLMYNGMPIIADLDAPWGHLYILDEGTMKVFSDQDWHFLDADGLTLRQTTGFDQFEAVMARYMNLGSVRRNTNAVITGALMGATDATGTADYGY